MERKRGEGGDDERGKEEEADMINNTLVQQMLYQKREDIILPKNKIHISPKLP